MRTPEERAALLVDSFERSGSLQALGTLVTSAIREAAEEERDGVEITLRLCVQVFDQALGLPGLPGDLRATMRACRGLCLSDLTPLEAGSPPCAGRK